MLVNSSLPLAISSQMQALTGIVMSAVRLQQYCQARGLVPGEVMPLALDAGTDDEELQNNSAYGGIKAAKLSGPALFQV